MLYIIATPIGNLADLSYRAVSTLQACDYILCEDTRHSHILLKHYEIKKPLKSYHKFNEKKRLNEILADLREGKNIALISDAGTPSIADPGSVLIDAVLKANLPVTSVPGPCALINALILSGLETIPFQFFGFVPKQAKALETLIEEALTYRGTSIVYDTAIHLPKTLEVIHRLHSDRLLVIAREMTKHFEEILRGSAQELLKKVHNFRGEIVLLISKETRKIERPLQGHVEELQARLGISHKEALKEAARQRGVPRRSLYQALHVKPK